MKLRPSSPQSATVLDPASEGKRWWSHIEFLADDKLEGATSAPMASKRRPPCRGAVQVIGLKPGARQATGSRSGSGAPSCWVATSRPRSKRGGGRAHARRTRRQARASSMGRWTRRWSSSATGRRFPRRRDELSGLDLHGKIAVREHDRAGRVSDNVRSHVTSAGELGRAQRRARSGIPRCHPAAARGHERRGAAQDVAARAAGRAASAAGAATASQGRGARSRRSASPTGTPGSAGQPCRSRSRPRRRKFLAGSGHTSTSWTSSSPTGNRCRASH